MDNLNNLRKGNAIRIGGVFYYIDSARVDDLESGELVIRGKSMAALMNERIVWENYSRQARPEVIMHDLANKHVVSPTNSARKLHQITLASVPNLGSPSVRFQNSYGIVLEQLEKLAEAHSIGFKETALDPFIPASHITFVKSRDLSGSVEFTTDAENVISESFEESDYDEKNIAIVAGEGEGAEREVISLGSGSGLDRKELYVDARDLQKENDDVTMTDTEYRQALTERGVQKLAEHQPVLILDGDINVQNQLYEYGVDYELGDIVRRSSPTFQLAYNAQITEIQEIYENGLQVIPTFGKRSPTLIDLIKRK